MQYKVTYYPAYCTEMYPHNLQTTVVKGKSKFDAVFHWMHDLAKERQDSKMGYYKSPVVYEITML